MSKSKNGIHPVDIPTFTVIQVAPSELVIVTNKSHPLFQERALWAVDENLVRDIKADGFNSQIIIGLEYPDRVEHPSAFDYVVVAGRQRVKAAIEAGVPEIPAMNIGDIANYSPSDLAALMVKENERRTNNNSLEKAREAQRLYNLHLDELKPADWTPELEFKPSKEEKAAAKVFVAEVFGISTGHVNSLLNLLSEEKVAPELIKAIERKEVSFEGALRFLKLTPDKQKDVLSQLKPVIERKAKEAEAGRGRGKAISGSEANSVINKNAKIHLDRSELEKTRARKHCPQDVKDYIKHLLNPGSIDLAYLPGRLLPIKESSAQDDNE